MHGMLMWGVLVNPKSMFGLGIKEEKVNFGKLKIGGKDIEGLIFNIPFSSFINFQYPKLKYFGKDSSPPLPSLPLQSFPFSSPPNCQAYPNSKGT